MSCFYEQLITIRMEGLKVNTGGVGVINADQSFCLFEDELDRTEVT